MKTFIVYLPDGACIVQASSETEARTKALDILDKHIGRALKYVMDFQTKKVEELPQDGPCFTFEDIERVEEVTTGGTLLIEFINGCVEEIGK